MECTVKKIKFGMVMVGFAVMTASAGISGSAASWIEGNLAAVSSNSQDMEWRRIH
jgi:hypothetical protein